MLRFERLLEKFLFVFNAVGDYLVGHLHTLSWAEKFSQLLATLALRLVHQILAVVVNKIEEIENERNLSRLLLNTMHAPQPHEHGLKRLFLFELWVEGNDLAFDNCVAALPCFAQSLDDIRHGCSVFIKPARVELDLGRLAALEMNLKTRAVVLHFKDNLFTGELLEYLAWVVNLLRVHKLIWTKECQPSALKALRALSGAHGGKADVVGHRVEMFDAVCVHIEGLGDCSGESSVADADPHLIKHHPRKISSAVGRRVGEDIFEQFQPILIALHRSIDALPELINRQRIGAANHARHDFAHVACVPDLIIYLVFGSLGSLDERCPDRARPDAQLIRQLRVNDFTDRKVCDRLKRSLIETAESCGKYPNPLRIALGFLNLVVCLREF